MPKIPASANQCLFTDARRQQMFDAFGCSQTGRRLANAETSENLAVGGDAVRTVLASIWGALSQFSRVPHAATSD